MLKQKQLPSPTSLTFGHTEHVALQKLAEIFQHKTQSEQLASVPTDIPKPITPISVPIEAPRA